MHGCDNSANSNIGISISAQLTNVRAVFLMAYYCESAQRVGCGWSTDIQEARAVGNLNHLVDMRGEAYVFIKLRGSLLSGNASAGGGLGGNAQAQCGQRKNNAAHRQNCFPGKKQMVAPIAP